MSNARSPAIARPVRLRPLGALTLLLLAGSCRVALAVDDGVWLGMEPPAGRYNHAAVYDPVRDRMIVYSGRYSEHSFVYNFDLWGLNLAPSPSWRPIQPTAGTSPGAFEGPAIYDPLRDRVLFPGPGATSMPALESLSGVGRWSTIAVSGTPPSDRIGYGLVYDAPRDRILLFGGQVENTYFNEVWALDLAGTPTWSDISPAGPAPAGRTVAGVVYDSIGERLIVLGGVSDWGSGSHPTDVWALSLSGTPAWTELLSTSPGALPRIQFAAMFDPVRNRVLIQGGQEAPNSDVWALSLSGSPSWSALVTTGAGPGVRFGHSALYDPVRDRALIYGGNDLHTYALGDVKILDLSTSSWSTFSPDLPAPRFRHVAIEDPLRRRMILYGGDSWDGGPFDDTWALDVTASTWTQLNPSGGPPPARAGASAIYDPVRQHMVLFGGQGVSFALDDVWTLDLAGAPTWTLLAPVGSPPPARGFHVAVFDPAGDRMIVFGGYGSGGVLGDLWQLTLSGTPTWSPLASSGSPPPPRYRQAAAFDPVGGRMLIHGGIGTGGSSLSDLWELTLAPSPAWSLLSPPSTSPGSRAGHSAVYEPGRQRLLVFGGGPGAAPVSNSTFALTLTGTPTWSLLSTEGPRPSGRCDQGAIWEGTNARMLIYGGQKCSNLEETVTFDNAFTLWFPTQVAVPPVPGSGLPRLAAFPVPSFGTVTLSFNVEGAGRARLAVYDLAGRRRADLLDRVLDAGPHSIPWTRPQREAAGLGPGVYLVELRVADRRSARTIVFTR